MPYLRHIATKATFGSASPHVSVAKLLSPFLSSAQQSRSASVLSSLSDVSTSYNKAIRRGRGPGSGKGKQSGRGKKGQGQRGGHRPVGFNGGQTPDIVVSGVRGFENNYAAELATLNISRVAKWISLGRLNPKRPITMRHLNSSGCISSPKEGVKLLARQDLNDDGVLNTPIQIVVSRASESAIKAVEAAGGTVVTRYYSPSSIRRVMKGQVHPYYSLQSLPLPKLAAGTVTAQLAGEVEGDEGEAVAEQGAEEEDKADVEAMRNAMAKYRYRLADATGRKDIEYYRDPAHRGYLSHLVEAGQGPSLYFDVPSKKSLKGKKKTGGGSKAGAQKASDRLW